MTNELITVPFHGNSLFVTTLNGQPYTPMKPIVEGMGLDWRSQATKFRGNKGRWGVAVITTPTNGNDQDAICLPLRKLPGWLMTLQPSRVASEIREKVVMYQNECDDALWDYWTKGQATRHAATSQDAEQLHHTIKDYLLLNERMNQLPGAEPTAVMDATLTMIQQNTGIQVDALRQVLPPRQHQSKSTNAQHTNVTTLEVKALGVFESMSTKLCPEFVSCALDEFEGHKLRIFKTALGEYWFGGIDVCAAMGYSNPHKALSDHVPNSQKRRIPIGTASGKQVMIIANELGVRDLIIGSLKPGAIRFRDWLDEKIPSSTQSLPVQSAVSSNNVSTNPLSELKIDGDISTGDIESWKMFCSQPMHTRLLQLHWISRNRNELAVLWTFCEHHRRTATLGEKYFRKDSGQTIDIRLCSRLHCNQRGISRSINTLVEEGVLGKKSHVDNVIRKLWLNWPVLAQRLRTDIPDQQVLQLNWLADNRAELSVLSMLAQQWVDSGCVVDGVRCAPFAKVTYKALQPHQALLSVSTNAKAVERAVTRLSEAGLIELSGQGVMHKARINTMCFNAIETFLATNFENELW